MLVYKSGLAANGAVSTVTVMTAVSVPPLPSLIVYGITTSPVNQGFGVNVIVPSGFNVAVHPVTTTVVPDVTDTPLISVIVRGFPSGSESFVNG